MEKKFFHTLKYKCVYDIKFTNITNNETVILNFSHDCSEFKTEYYWLNKKSQKCKI